MAAKVWQVESIKNHLSAVQVGIQASPPKSLMPDTDGRLAAYHEGSDVVLKYLTERFGIGAENNQPEKKSPPYGLKLRTWSREEIKRNLEVAWLVLRAGDTLLQQQDHRLTAYYKGMEDTLSFLAMSFGIEGFKLPSRNGSTH